jgi:hypothetical protein
VIDRRDEQRIGEEKVLRVRALRLRKIVHSAIRGQRPIGVRTDEIHAADFFPKRAERERYRSVATSFADAKSASFKSPRVAISVQTASRSPER